MKRTLAILLASMMMLGIMAGCSSGGTSQATATPTAETVEYSDTIVIGENTEPKFLDPDQAYGATEAKYSSLIYEGLVREDANGSIIPLLAESWDISDDGLTYTFKLKEGVKFSDGTAVTGEDWIWSLERARDCPDSNSRTVASAISTVEAPDDNTLVITLSQPVACFMANLCKWNMVVKSKAHYDAVGAESFLTSPMGTGPYALAEWKQGEYLKYTANEYYHVEGKPYTKNVTYQIIPDDNTRLMQLQAGQIDIMPSVPVNMMEQISADSSLVAQSFPGTQIRFIVINCTQAPFDNQLVRTALNYATDKQAILDMVASGYGQVATSFVSSTYTDLFNDELTERGPDIAKAKSLLAEAGYPDGVKVTIKVKSNDSVYENIATILQSQWAEAGIDLEIESLESATMISQIKALDYQCTLLQWTDSTPDPSDIGAYECRYSDSLQWYSGMQDQDLEDAYMATITEMDSAKRAELFKVVQQKVYDVSNIVPLFQANFAYGSSNKVEGLVVTPFNKIDAASLKKVK